MKLRATGDSISQRQLHIFVRDYTLEKAGSRVICPGVMNALP